MARKVTPKFDITGTWLKRDGNTYVIHHDTLLPQPDLEEYITKVLFSKSTLAKLLTNMLPPARSILRAMGIVRIQIKLTEDKNATDYYTIWLGTNYFDDLSLTELEKVSIFLGLTVHEGSHILHTDKEMTRKVIGKNETLHYIWNIIEDERIEFLTCMKFPGYGSFLAETKKYMFGKMPKLETYRWYITPLLTEEEEVIVNGKSVYFTNRDTRIKYEMGLFGYIIRFPRDLTDDDVEYFFTVMEEVKQALTPYPETNEECLVSAREVYEYFLKILPPAKSEEEPSEEEKEKILEAIIKELTEWLNALSTTGQLSEKDLQIVDETLEECKGNFFLKEPNNVISYNEALNKVRPYIPTLKSFFTYLDEDKNDQLRSLKSGFLDTRKIVEAAHGIQSVYFRDTMSDATKWDICLLADLSGSMWGTKIDACLQTIVLLTEAFSNRKDTELFVYGHTADDIEYGAVTVSVFKEPNYFAPYSIGSISSRDNNRDGDAILLTAKRVRGFSKNPIVMFVISDGYPNAYGYIGATAIADTRDKVSIVEGMGFYVIHVAIDSVNSSSMFKHFVTFTDLKSLPIDLNVMVRRVLKNVV